MTTWDNTVEGKEGFGYTGGEQTFTVPAGVCSIEVTLNGAGGGGGDNFLEQAGVGGAGEQVIDTIDVTPLEELTVIVGGGGEAGRFDGFPAMGGYGGGDGGDGSPSTTAGDGPYSGGGGGASSIKRGSTILIASGGGGGGSDSGSVGGNGGGPDGGAGGKLGLGGAAQLEGECMP